MRLSYFQDVEIENCAHFFAIMTIVSVLKPRSVRFGPPGCSGMLVMKTIGGGIYGFALVKRS